MKNVWDLDMGQNEQNHHYPNQRDNPHLHPVSTQPADHSHATTLHRLRVLNSLQQYFTDKYGDGWKYVMEAQAVRKIMQSIGRLIRNENDRGVAVILDERATRFTEYVKLEKSASIVDDIDAFFTPA